MNMNEEKVFLSAREVATYLGIGEASAYKIVHKLNESLEKKGYLVIAGKIPTAYLKDQIYGGGSVKCL